ncbi:uncharacterized protein BDV14DRAFT_199622 [Aspergillus stella-maris]|uniref:uncharacterized protein n=1 Tax=Aspergillus stella-maris TaxID=1810926 RepID=UPI003CCDE511
MDPYETNSSKIPSTDLYADVPLYGRYTPQQDDFKPESIEYWEPVLSLCTKKNRIYPADEGGRDVFASGSVIVKSGHLVNDLEAGEKETDYFYADRNEIEAIRLARGVLGRMGVRVPCVYFAGRVKDYRVLIQERLPGVVLSIAKPYLTTAQRESFKEQA